MKRVRVLALAAMFALFACQPEALAPTQVTLSIDTRTDALREQIDAIRITIARSLADSEDALEGGAWLTPQIITVPRRHIDDWPLEIPVIPKKMRHDASYFEVVVDALRGNTVLAQTRGITRFDPREWRRFPLWLSACADRAVCEADADCRGLACQFCDGARGCVPVDVTDPNSLDRPDRDVDDAGQPMPSEAGRDASPEGKRDASPGLRDAQESDAQRDAPDSAPPESDAGDDPSGPPTCATEGALRCVAGSASARERCEAGAWVAAEACELGKTCATGGDGQASCRGGCDGVTCDDANATCAVVNGEPRCQCKPPYVGDGNTCSRSDECAALACNANTAECVLEGDKRVCKCRAGYSGDGKTCTNVDECKQTPAPCNVNATCTDTAGSYGCACKQGFSGDGKACTNTDECAATPCMHGGKCTDLVNGFTCNCAGTDHSGTRCETKIDNCSPSACLNGGRCTDGVSSFTCSCAAGYTGTRCETDVDNCAPNPCQNGGTCADRVNGYQCSCPAGWLGTRCETRSCGDGIVNAGEECDYMASGTSPWKCSRECKRITIYAPCRTTNDCNAGEYCYPRLYFCTKQCSAPGRAGVESGCPTPAGGLTPFCSGGLDVVCLATGCARDEECALGMSCYTGDPSYCLGCVDSLDCPNGQSCVKMASDPAGFCQ